ncbi:phosphodiester glycosidase family protein [Paenibacillus nanensis]|uniref:Phosphodiester glycosidase family protein n=1 Tax=Paenibacillus nanensis TaxID=393251 RepID=A0A3A1UW26_9BACL|nr:phosphodiester glycosidase family protein [Paenibacillus nanensis]RIX48665.1 phosphodiester glycosidase family protein [Paenibacillus nanensis]
MKQPLFRPYRWAVIYSVILTASVSFTLLDTFVLPKSLADASFTSPPSTTVAGSSGSAASSWEDVSAAAETETVSQSKAVITDTSYEDENVKISIETVRKYDSTLYVADIQVSDPSYLKTALANQTYGRNITATTSDIAEENNAIFAINGDFYGFRDSGYVLRNGVAYRDTARSGDNDALVIDKDGNLSVVSEGEVSMDSLSEQGAWQVLSFGPGLVEGGSIVVDSSSEVGKAMASNPRTAIGQVSELHYMVVVSDGRTSESEGLSLLQLAQELKDRGCTVAYNLDGGGSSTMYFNGEVVNKPTSGRSIGERKVSDIVYIGY